MDSNSLPLRLFVGLLVLAVGLGSIDLASVQGTCFRGRLSEGIAASARKPKEKIRGTSAAVPWLSMEYPRSRMGACGGCLGASLRQPLAGLIAAVCTPITITAHRNEGIFPPLRAFSIPAQRFPMNQLASVFAASGTPEEVYSTSTPPCPHGRFRWGAIFVSSMPCSSARWQNGEERESYLSPSLRGQQKSCPVETCLEN